MKFLHSPMDSCKHYLQSREVQTDALRFFMCIYAALKYILLPKGQILKCPAWMHKVQSGNYAFLLCCSGRYCYLPTGELHTLGTAEVTSIAGLKGTEKRRRKKDGEEESLVDEPEVQLFTAHTPAGGKGRYWMTCSWS